MTALHRDPEKAVFGGVAAGLAQRFGLNVVLVRVVFALLAAATLGVAALPYLAAWAILPPSPPERAAPAQHP